MINLLKRIRIASEKGHCISVKIDPKNTTQEFLDAIDDEAIDTILFRDWYFTLIKGNERREGNLSYLKLWHHGISREKAERFLDLYGMIHCLDAIKALREDAKISLSVIRKLNPPKLFNPIKDWMGIASDYGEDFSVTTFRNKISDEVEIVVSHNK